MLERFHNNIPIFIFFIRCNAKKKGYIMMFNQHRIIKRPLLTQRLRIYEGYTRLASSFINKNGVKGYFQKIAGLQLYNIRG
jgi:hypothetical protein